MKKILLIGLIVLGACSRGGQPGAPRPTPVAPDSFTVAFTTTEGEFVMKAHRDWSPAAVDRFHEIIRAKTYDGVRIFRVVPDFVAQFGLTGVSATDSLWRSRRVPDEPVKVSNTAGRVSFARGGPESRTLQIFINLVDNSGRLDKAVANGIQGYPPFAEVISGMDVVSRLEGKYGEAPGRMQGDISRSGWATLDAQFPDLDRIIRTRITKEWK